MENREFYQFDRGSVKEFPIRLKIALKLIEEFKIRAESYLDVGCADGRVANIISSNIKAKKVYGVDISEKLIEKASKKGIISYNIDVSSEILPFKKNFFDFITMFELIEHLFDPDFALEEINRVLKPGGMLLLSTPNLSYWLNRFIFLFGYKPYGVELSTKYLIGEPGGIKKSKMAGHIRVFNLRSLVQILKIYGFKPIKIVSVPLISRNIMFKALDKLFTSISPSFAQIVLILSKKVKR